MNINYIKFEFLPLLLLGPGVRGGGGDSRSKIASVNVDCRSKVSKNQAPQRNEVKFGIVTLDVLLHCVKLQS